MQDWRDYDTWAPQFRLPGIFGEGRGAPACRQPPAGIRAAGLRGGAPPRPRVKRPSAARCRERQ